MARLHINVLFIFSSCQAFSPASIGTRTNTKLQELSSGSPSESDATAASLLQTDSSYEALRKKFGLANDPNVQEVHSTSVIKYDTNKDESELSENDVDSATLDDATETGLDPSLSSSSDHSPEIEIELRLSKPEATIYSRTFPRYSSIPLTIIDSVSKDEIKKEAEQRRQRRLRNGVIVKLNPASSIRENRLLGGLLKNGMNILSASTKAKLEKAYSDYPFRWATSRSNGNCNPLLVDQDFVAAVNFWRMAADISKEKVNENKRWYLALPETTISVAQNLCDILNWYAGNIVRGNNRKDGAIIIDARLDNTYSNSLPVIEFALEHHLEEKQSITSNRQPTAEDTEKRTKSWVQRLLVNLSICPFTKSETKSGQGLGDLGVPVGNIMYRHSDASTIDYGAGGEVYALMADTWEAISDMIASGTSGKEGVSSIILSAPGFDDNFDLWSGPVFAMLEAGVGAIHAEEIIGIVCFHPKYETPDGRTFPGFGHMHSLPRLKKWYDQFRSSGELTDNEIAAGGAWMRRTPHAVINVLRAEQLEAAEVSRESGILYERNIRVLVGRDEGIGSERLEEELKREQSL